jgi:hypothetical protein
VAEIPGPEPAVADRLHLLVHVADRDLRPSDQHLAVAGDADLGVRKGLTDGPDPVPAQPVQRHQRGFGQPVGVVDLDAEVAEGPQQLRVDRRRAHKQLPAAIQARAAQDRATHHRSEGTTKGSLSHPPVPASDRAATELLP